MNDPRRAPPQLESTLRWKSFGLHLLGSLVALFVVDGMFESITFTGIQPLLLAAILLSFTNIFLKPLLLVATLPLTVMSAGLLLPVLNGLLLMFVAQLVPGFQVSGFWMAVLASLAVSLVGMLFAMATGQMRVRGVRVNRVPGTVIDVEAREKRDDGRE